MSYLIKPLTWQYFDRKNVTKMEGKLTIATTDKQRIKVRKVSQDPNAVIKNKKGLQLNGGLFIYR